MKLKTKKGSVIDILFYTVMIPAVILGVIITYYVVGEVHNEVATIYTTEEEVNISQAGVNAISDFDMLFAFIYVGIALATVVSAFAVRSHPVLFVVFFLVQLIAIYLSGQMVTVWDTITGSDTLSGSMGWFEWSDLLMDNFSVLTLIFSIAVALAMLALPR